MHLAKSKNGLIGRQIPGVGDEARIQSASLGERRGDLYLSTGSIEADEAYFGEKEARERAFRKAKRVQKIAKAHAERIAQEKAAAKASRSQALSGYDPIATKLQRYFAKRQTMGETAQVLADLQKPADFSSSGANPEYVPGNRMTGGEEWRADFRQHLIVGNVLTRDGEFGPAITDFDRFVNGVDVNQTDVVVGGTMVGRLDNSSIKTDLVSDGMGGVKVFKRGMRGMGFDWSWSGITDAISNVADQTVDQTLNSLPEQLSKELQDALKGGGTVQSSSGGTVVVQRPVTGATTTIQQTLGIPPWALYTGIGVLGLGLMFVMIKAVKS